MEPWKIATILICIALGIVLIATRFRISLPSRKPSEKKQADAHPAPAHEPAHGANDHHHGGKSGIKKAVHAVGSVLLAVWYVALVALVVFGSIWLYQDSIKLVQANSTYSVGQAAAAQARAARGGRLAATSSCPVVSDDWKRTTLPQGGADWPSWISVPVCHTIQFCDPVNDPGCSAKDFSNVRFDAQCRSLSDGHPRSQESGDCTWTDAYRMRAKGSDPMPLLYRFVRAS